ncbi:MAG: hypothetical protein RLZZ196_171 [Bacteroidota bacterium]|jgi:hypothetical protein
MEYVLGSLVTAFLLFTLNKIVNVKGGKAVATPIIPSQSYVFKMIQPALPILNILGKPKLKTQATSHIDSLYVRVIIVEDKAYWIKDNSFFVANMQDGLIDKESATVVDIMAMDTIQLDKMSFIVDKLTEDLDDIGNSGNSWL